jgi:hypothetical protein
VEVVNNIPHSVENLSVAYSRVHQKIKSVDLSIVNSAHFKTIKFDRFCNFCVAQIKSISQ